MYYYEDDKKKGVYIWIVVLILIVVIANTPIVKRSKILHGARILANNIIFPFKFAVAAVYDGSTAGVHDFLRLKGIQKENEQLKKELNEYKAKMVMEDELALENERLRRALSFRSSKGSYNLLPAEIIGRSGSIWFNVVELNRGSSNGIILDSAVINQQGLVGRISEVSKFSSKVLLITDPTSAVSIIDAQTADMGIASGNSIGPIKIKYLSSTADVKVGDKIITSGMSDVFPRGITVGTIRSVDKKDYDIFQKVDVQPSVDLSKLDKVFVIIR